VRSLSVLVRKRQVLLFLLIGGSIAVLGHALLVMLIGAGVVAGVANAIQIVLTLQLSFLAHDFVTWRRHTLDPGARRFGRWWRFQVARGASAVLSLVVFPFLAPVVGIAAAYWGLLVTGPSRTSARTGCGRSPTTSRGPPCLLPR
jgi:glycosyltransferase XagB